MLIKSWLQLHGNIINFQLTFRPGLFQPVFFTWYFNNTMHVEFLCICQAPIIQSLWSGYHWKDLFLLQNVSTDLWWQFWSKVMTSEEKQRPTPITARYGRHRSQWVELIISNFITYFLQVATWIDETLSSVASKLEHPTQGFAEFSGDKVVAIHTCSLYTCAQMSSGALYWW